MLTLLVLSLIQCLFLVKNLNSSAVRGFCKSRIIVTEILSLSKYVRYGRTWQT